MLHSRLKSFSQVIRLVSGALINSTGFWCDTSKVPQLMYGVVSSALLKTSCPDGKVFGLRSTVLGYQNPRNLE